MKQTPKKKSNRKTVALKQRPRRGRKLLRRGRFLPAILITGFAAFLNLQPYLQTTAGGVLAYATNTSAAGLLVSTNSQRSAHGVASLSANGQLNAAAQAKANDMVARNYWSHQTPDGQQPWVFITNAGYQYSTAGENLAYGFMTSSDTVTGWMNSPPHKANLISSNYTEVGFGIANSSNYVGDGPQTVVVAMYGKPLGAATPAPAAPAPMAPPAPSNQAVQQASKPAASEPEQSSEEQPAKESDETASEETDDEREPITIAATGSTNNPVTAAASNVPRVQLISGDFANWSMIIVITAVISSLVLWLIHKGLRLRNYLVAGEKFIASHIHLDFTVLAILFLAYTLLDTSGFIR